MDRRELLKLLAGAGIASATPDLLKADAIGRAPALSPEFQWLRMGEVKPAGWIREQMLRDLRQGFAGCLDKLCREASSDIFVTNRNTAKAQNTGNELGVNWWNGETEGNWRTGHIMMAYLSEDSDATAKADRYVEHILGSQDADGYLGVFAPDLRFTRQGELWTQACLMRGLIAYYELTRKEEVMRAVRRAANLTMTTYRSGRHPLPVGESHDLMFVDVMEWLYDLTGDPAYREFAVWFYDQWSQKESKWDATLPSLLDLNKGFVDHGVHTYENIRVPLWLAAVTDRHDIQRAAQNALLKIARYSELSGSGVSEEWIKDLSPDPSQTEYEYCATKELQFTFESALQKTGRADYGDRVEWIWFNAAQGSRLPDGSAISYLTSDNRYHCAGRTIDGKAQEKRNKFSPTHSDVAVCCNPNATQVAALFVRGMWMRSSDGLVAALYGPCTVTTSVAGTTVRIEERTHYPFTSSIAFEIHPQKPVEFPLRLRDPLWSSGTKVVCDGAKIKREGQYWVATKKWKKGDVVRLEFTPRVEQIKASNGEIALRYSALLFAQPLPSTQTAVKHYDVQNMQDSYFEPASESELASSPASADQFRVVQRDAATEETAYPFDTPVIQLQTKDPSPSSATEAARTLVPLGNAPALRRVSFPSKTVKPGPLTT